MTYGSCRFLFHQFIQRDKAHEIRVDADTLATLPAAHESKAFITQLPGYIILADPYKEIVKLKDSLA